MFAEDEWPGSWHLGARLDGELVATSSWVPAPARRPAGVQLRGMATHRGMQGTGIGGVLLEPGCELAAERGFTLVWARRATPRSRSTSATGSRWRATASSTRPRSCPTTSWCAPSA